MSEFKAMLTNVIIESMANRRVLVTTNEFCFTPLDI